MIWLRPPALHFSISTKGLLTSSALRATCVVNFRSTGWKTLPRNSRGVVSTAQQSKSSGMMSPIYNWQDNVENLEGYRMGGYHPIQLGDEFSDSRYLVIHKLGYGSFSTVWLARDRMKHRYVSLKVMTAQRRELGLEAGVMNCLRCGDPHHPGRPFVLSLLDQFLIDGPNGRHQCLVSEAAGPSILQVTEGAHLGYLPIETAQRITGQLALGLAYIHSCGIIHGG